MDYIIIAVNMESAEIFSDFANEHPDLVLPVEHKAFIGPDEIMEFIITMGPPTLSALAAYLVARIQYTKKEIKVKKGDMEIDLKGIDITPNEVMEMLLKLEQKKSDE
jgi:hypothetical protein